MAEMLSETDWEDLLWFIKEEKCTPFIGAGACAGVLPLGADIARSWAEQYQYPLLDSHDLARVAQFLAIARYEMFPKDTIKRQFGSVAPPNFNDPAEPHAVLASLNLPIYITTNYDSFMLEALKHRKRQPVQEFCRWNNFPQVTGSRSVFEDGYQPTAANPLVYHLHGHIGMSQSLVLTEGDYLDFLIRLSRDQSLLPPPIRTALAGTSLLFVGYSLTDWNFRVLFRGLVGSLGASLGYTSIAVQLPPNLSQIDMERARGYLNKYFDQLQQIRVSIYWGDVREFALELRQRWEKFRNAG
ncbi:MAG: hypothetical protein BroJett021_50110 [Chloroflexota bacterium]|nr:SIR2 family protein [Caldilinea sp.]GIK76023.1 MAG: hypothetical protein BroJett021_50110 [Chloroflexota bacterium]